MAVHLAKAGHHVVGYNRSPQRTAALVEAGGTAADSIAKAVAGADVVAVMVPDSPDVQAVLQAVLGELVMRRVRRCDHNAVQRHHLHVLYPRLFLLPDPEANEDAGLSGA
jgi:lactate dehydrogenase-like 2-hydroxyacid dehydrogenase